MVSSSGWRSQSGVWLPWLVLLWWLVLALPSASAQKTFSTRYSNTAVNGDIVLIGNVNYHCSTTPPVPPATSPTTAEINSCTSARSGGTVINNNVYMVPIGASSGITNSSSATLTLPTGSTVLFAGLYWSGLSTSATNRSTVLFAGPSGAFSAVGAADSVVIGGNVYQSFANVTGSVTSGGVYTVGNIASTVGNNTWAGWTLVVAFRNATLATKNLTVFDGLQQANNAASPVDIGVSGFITPSVGTVDSTIGVVAYDGDRGSLEGSGAGGSLQFGTTTGTLSAVSNGTNPVNDVFNSTITALGTDVTAGRTPAYTNTLGLDIDTLKPNTALPNGSTSAVVRVVGTAGDVIYPGVITLATEIFVPNLKDAFTKTVTDLNGGAVLPGDVLQYELYLKNLGKDGALNVVLTDTLPANTSYVPGSLQYTAGANSGAKTDAAGDDQADYAAASRVLTMRLGSGASSSAGGSLATGEEARVRFRVQVNSGVAGGSVIDNSGSVTSRQQTLGGSVTDVSDSDATASGDQPARVVVATPDLTLDKAHSGNAVANGNATFTLSVTNAGTAPTFGAVTVTDTLPGALSAVSIAGTGWTCTLASVTCTRSDVLAAGASFPAITLVTKVASGTPTGTVTNTASVQNGAESSTATGNNSDSDALTVQARPAVSLTKTVRNVTAGGEAGTSSSARPGQTLEYCVGFSNTGGDAPNFVIRDTAPGNTTALTSAYGTGLGVQLTLGSTTALTSAADSDAASLLAGTLTYGHGTLAQGQSGRVCFQVTVN